MIDLEFLKKQFEKNFDYVVQNGYYGMEPHIYDDLYFTNKANLNPTFINKVFRKLEVKIILHLPFLIKPYCKLIGLDYMLLTPYGFGFFLQAFAKAYMFTNSKKYLNEIYATDKILSQLLIKLKHGYGVTYAKSDKEKMLGKIKINNSTANVPGGVECSLGYLESFKATKDKRFLELSKSITTSFMLDFKIKKYGDKSCFDYSNQGDDTHILNANILVALSLLEVSKEENSIKCNELIMSSYNYILEYLKNYADLPYAGKEDKYINKFWKSYDCYHTGFVLRSMYKINKELNENKDFNLIFSKVKKMMQDFIFNGIVCMFKKSKVYDIHAFAEYIYTYSIFYNYFSEKEKNDIEQIIKNSFKLFISKRDSRRYIYKKSSFLKVDEYMPLWGQAAMMNAIINLIIVKAKS